MEKEVCLERLTQIKARFVMTGIPMLLLCLSFLSGLGKKDHHQKDRTSLNIGPKTSI